MLLLSPSSLVVLCTGVCSVLMCLKYYNHRFSRLSYVRLSVHLMSVYIRLCSFCRLNEKETETERQTHPFKCHIQLHMAWSIKVLYI